MTTSNPVIRFNLLRRIEHALLILSFSTLGLTGLIQKYSQAGVSEWLVAVLGGIEIVRIIHRVAAVMFFLECDLSLYLRRLPSVCEGLERHHAPRP